MRDQPASSASSLHAGRLPNVCYPMLLAVASRIELAAVLAGVGVSGVDPEALRWRAMRINERLDVVMTGVGKSNAAAATALCLERRAYGSVVSIGIAGALPCGERTMALTTVVLGSRCVYADEGVQTPEEFIDCAGMGFPLGPFDRTGIVCDEVLRVALRPLVDVEGPIATVSTCSGTDGLAGTVQARTGAIAECMEGAAVAHVAAAWPAGNTGQPVRAGELRVISNTTGNRSAQQWAMKGATTRLERLACDLLGAMGDAKPSGE